VLESELRIVPAPEHLWLRVEAALNNPHPERERTPGMMAMWVLASAAAILVVAYPTWSRHRQDGGQDRALDLGAYLEPVQTADAAGSDPAIYRVPPHFANVSNVDERPQVAGYKVLAERVSQIHGEPVKQIILAVGDSAVALFVASSKVKMDTGANEWVEDNMAGMACKRLNCPRVRTFQFPCSAATCVIICKACSQTSMQALITQVSAWSPVSR
jgi:hypothetical protein